MEVSTPLVALSTLHPNLLWEDMTAAAVAVLSAQHPPPFRLELTVEGVPAFDDPSLVLALSPEGISPEYMLRLRRTFEPSRLVEMTAIAVAGLAMFHAAHQEMRDIALRGSGADYLVGQAGHLLEVGGRSRRSDLGAAWQEKWQALSEREGGGFYLCVVEFETPAGRLAFHG